MVEKSIAATLSIRAHDFNLQTSNYNAPGRRIPT